MQTYRRPLTVNQINKIRINDRRHKTECRKYLSKELRDEQKKVGKSGIQKTAVIGHQR